MGLAYGSEPVNIVAKINSTTVYSGPLPTIDQPVSPVPEPIPTDMSVLFSIDNSSALNTDFAGSLPMTIEVSGGSGVIFGDILSNYCQEPNTAVYANGEIPVVEDPNSTTEQVNAIIVPKANPPFNATEMAFLNIPGPYTQQQNEEFQALLLLHNIPCYVSSGPNEFQSNYIGTPVNSENTPDPRSTVYINGVQQVPPTPVSHGVWNWFMPAGSTFAYNWNISTGFGGNPANYVGPYTPTV
jgi:hypothetical protein